MNYGTAPNNPSSSLKTTLFWGFSILLLSFLVQSMIRISYLNNSAPSFTPDLITILRQPIGDPLLQIILAIISFGGYIFAGFVSGKRVQKRNVLIGGLIGGLWVVFTSVLMIFYFLNGINLASELGSSQFVRDNFTTPSFIAFLWSIPQDLLVAMLLSGIGGGIAHAVDKNNKK